MKRLRANTLKDHWDFFLHIGVTAGIAAGAFFALGFPPILTGLAIAGTLGIKLGLGPWISRAMHKAIGDEKAVSEREHWGDRFHLGHKIEDWVEKFSERMHLRSVPRALFTDKTQPVHTEKGLSGSFRNALRKELNTKANAFAFKHDDHGSVVVNTPIAEELDENELHGVVAHEVGHIAAGHHIKRDIAGYISSPAVLLTNLNHLVTALSSFKNFGLVWAGMMIGKAAGDFAEKQIGWRSYEPEEQEKIKNIKSVVRNVATIGLGALFGAPELMLAVGLNYLTTKAVSLSQKQYSRRKEFQADRIAAELTGDPEALSDGLHKITNHYKTYTNDFKPREDGILTRIFERINDIGKTHPNVYRRAEKLENMRLPALDIA